MVDLFGVRVSFLAKMLGIPLPVALAAMLALGAYQGCMSSHDAVATRHSTLIWTRNDDIALCVPGETGPLAFSLAARRINEQCGTSTPILRGLDFSSNMERGLCGHRGFWIWGLCHTYDWGRTLGEGVPVLHDEDRDLIDYLWQMAYLTVRFRCGVASDIISTDGLAEKLKSYADTAEGTPLHSGHGVIPRDIVFAAHFADLTRCKVDLARAPACIHKLIAQQNLATSIVLRDPAAAEPMGIDLHMSACPILAPPQRG